MNTLSLIHKLLRGYPLCSSARVSKRNMSVRLFEDKDHASLYAKYRPTYPEATYSTIFEFYEQGKGDKCNYSLSVDVGCGNGQSSRPLCKKFRHVIGYDVSGEQLNSTKRDLENLTLRVGPAEDLTFLDDESVDLVTVAQALHWFDLDKFYKEVKRVLKPGGVFAAYGYGNHIHANEEANKIAWKFYSELLGPYWDKMRKHIDDQYASIAIPFEDQKRVHSDNISIHLDMPVEAYIGYLSTWSGWRAYHQKHPESNELDIIHDKMKAIYGNSVKITWPGFLLLGRKQIS